MEQKRHRDISESDIQRQRNAIDLANEPIIASFGKPKIVNDGGDLRGIDHALSVYSIGLTTR